MELDLILPTKHTSPLHGLLAQLGLVLTQVGGSESGPTPPHGHLVLHLQKVLLRVRFLELRLC